MNSLLSILEFSLLLDELQLAGQLFCHTIDMERKSIKAFAIHIWPFCKFITQIIAVEQQDST